MDGIRNRTVLAALVLAVTAALALAACSRGGSAGEDKAGGSEPVVLREGAVPTEEALRLVGSVL